MREFNPDINLTECYDEVSDKMWGTFGVESARPKIRRGA